MKVKKKDLKRQERKENLLKNLYSRPKNEKRCKAFELDDIKKEVLLNEKVLALSNDFHKEKVSNNQKRPKTSKGRISTLYGDFFLLNLDTKRRNR
ncbi:hypothetical protein O9G_001275 [Rozella allomycis CSF55]|uniref:Uncharacterized protein n=1 Tax=Rozella allomycis (strain CSF55) TaxID=988480 RepID=A0A075AY87_ROZAC|nr:hypothetical protein O9G_001275 [Rozella allomycis CSF55]|eukprot:EPZ33524.1 hypothetical protein O9G_001275 [Rozella allomycis CSF55]